MWRNGRRGRFKPGFLRVRIPCPSFTTSTGKGEINMPCIDMIGTGRNMPTIDNFIVMAGIFGVKVDDIIRIRMI